MFIYHINFYVIKIIISELHIFKTFEDLSKQFIIENDWKL